MNPANRDDGPSASSRAAADDVPEHDAALGIADDPRCRPTAGKVREERVERADRSGEQCSAPPCELPLDAIDVDAGRHDQPWITVERVDEPVEQKRDLAGVRRADDERETHQPIVVGAFAAASLRAIRVAAKSGKDADHGRPGRRRAAPATVQLFSR